MDWDWLDPIHGVGYQFWSGIGATALPLWIGLMLYLGPDRCQQLGCRRKARKINQAGVPMCTRHLE